MPVLNSAGGLDFGHYEAKARKMSVEALNWSMGDCLAAFKATGHAYYMDELSCYHREWLKRFRQGRAKARKGGVR